MEGKADKSPEENLRNILKERWLKKTDRKTFLKITGLGLAHFVLLNAGRKPAFAEETGCSPIDETRSSVWCEPSHPALDPDQCVLFEGKDDTCDPVMFDPDECKLVEKPGDTDLCSPSPGKYDPDECEPENGVDGDECKIHPDDVDECKPDKGDKDQCLEFKGDFDYCQPTSPCPEKVTEKPGTTQGNVGPAGGTVDDGQGTSVVVPPGALSAPIDIYILRPSFGYPRTADGKRIMVTRQFAPDGTEFTVPVEITIPCTPGEAAGTDTETLSFYLFDEPTSSWQPVPAVKEGSPLVGYTLTAQVFHFSVYGIGGTFSAAPVPASKNWALALLGFLGLAILGRFGRWREDKSETQSEE